MGSEVALDVELGGCRTVGVPEEFGYDRAGDARADRAGWQAFDGARARSTRRAPCSAWGFAPPPDPLGGIERTSGASSPPLNSGTRSRQPRACAPPKSSTPRPATSEGARAVRHEEERVGASPRSSARPSVRSRSSCGRRAALRARSEGWCDRVGRSASAGPATRHRARRRGVPPRSSPSATPERRALRTRRERRHVLRIDVRLVSAPPGSRRG